MKYTTSNRAFYDEILAINPVDIKYGQVYVTDGIKYE